MSEGWVADTLVSFCATRGVSMEATTVLSRTTVDCALVCGLELLCLNHENGFHHEASAIDGVIMKRKSVTPAIFLCVFPISSKIIFYKIVVWLNNKKPTTWSTTEAVHTSFPVWPDRQPHMMGFLCLSGLFRHATDCSIV